MYEKQLLIYFKNILVCMNWFFSWKMFIHVFFRYIKYWWIYEIVRNISTLSSRYLELIIISNCLFFSLRPFRICKQNLLVFERNKKKTGKIEGALTMNLIRDKRRIYIWIWAMCKEIMTNKSVWDIKTFKVRKTIKKKTSFLIFNINFLSNLVIHTFDIDKNIFNLT
jgi:hypothetical protein